MPPAPQGNKALINLDAKVVPESHFCRCAYGAADLDKSSLLLKNAWSLQQFCTMLPHDLDMILCFLVESA